MAMMKHMAAAVLYAVVGLLGPADIDSIAGDGDSGGEDDARLECVTYAAEPGRRGDSLVLSAASRLCGESIDGAWVIEHHRRATAAAAVHQTRDQVAMVDLAGDPVEAHATLLAAALDQCRASGALKVLVRAPRLREAEVRHLAEPRGYRFSRSRVDGDAAVVEFYTDLYWSEHQRLT